MSRFVLLADIDDVTLSVPAVADATLGAPAPAPVVKADPDVSFADKDEEGRFWFDVSAYNDATHNVLNAIHVGLYEKGPDGKPLAPVPEDPAEVVNAPNHFVTDTSKIREAKRVMVDGTDAPEGRYLGRMVLEFAE